MTWPILATDADWVADVVMAYQVGRPLALLFDYDGTLTPIVSRPHLACLSTAARDRLAALRGLPGVAVGVLSGRALAEVRQFVGLDGLWYAGSGGLELDLAGKRLADPASPAFDRLLNLLQPKLNDLVNRHPGVWLERKPAAFTVHYRQLADAEAERFPATIAAALDGVPGVRIRDVSRAVELTPVGGWDKGTAVRLILDRLPADTLPVYAGDAANDDEAFAVVAAIGGVAIGVGSEAPLSALVRVTDFTAFEKSLTVLVSALCSARRVASCGQPAVEVETSRMLPAAGASDPTLLWRDCRVRGVEQS